MCSQQTTSCLPLMYRPPHPCAGWGRAQCGRPCLVSTELWSQDSASQTYRCSPEGPGCITSHRDCSGTSLDVSLSGEAQPAVLCRELRTSCCGAVLPGHQPHPTHPCSVEPLACSTASLHPAPAFPCSSWCRWPATIIVSVSALSAS